MQRKRDSNNMQRNRNSNNMPKKNYMDDYDKRDKDFCMEDRSKETYEEIVSYMEEAIKHARNKEYEEAVHMVSEAFAAADIRESKDVAKKTLNKENVDQFIQDANAVKTGAVYANRDDVNYYLLKLSVYQRIR